MQKYLDNNQDNNVVTIVKQFRATAAETRPTQFALLHFAQEKFANCSFVCKSISTTIRILLRLLSLKKGPSNSDVFIGIRLAQNICKSCITKKSILTTSSNQAVAAAVLGKKDGFIGI